ncbi:MAG: hypothetical protein ACLTVV_08810 [Ruminococcus sp.]
MREKISKDIHIRDFFSKINSDKMREKISQKRKARKKTGIEKIGEGEKNKRENKKIKKSCGT